MALAVGELVLGRFRVEACPLLAGGALTADARDTEGERAVRLIALELGEPAMAPDPGRLLADQDRYRLGVEEIAPPVLCGIERDAAGRERLVVAYERRADESLHRLLGTPQPGARIAEIVRGFGRALAPLHDQGIAFGLLRPDLVSLRAGSVSVEGFGFETVARTTAGSRAAVEALPPAYLAPELRSTTPGAASPYSDAYTIGVIVTELVTGKILDGSEPLTSPRALGADVSDQVEALVRRATARSLVQRPESIARFCEELATELLIPHVPLPVVPVSAPVPAPEAPSVEPAPVEQTVVSPLLPAPQPQPQRQPQPPAPPPQQRIPEPPPSLRSQRSGLFMVLALAGGVLLMLLAVGGMFLYAQLRETPPPSVVTVTPDAGAFEFDAGTVEPAPPPPAIEDAGSPEEERDAGRGWGSLAPDAGNVSTTPDAAPPVAAGEGEAGELLPVGADVPVLGAPLAPVTVMVFGDLECPHTRRAVRVLQALTRAFPTDVRLAWRHRPLSIHSSARPAARVAAGLGHDAGDAVFWRFVGELAGSTEPPDTSHLEKWTQAAGGDASRVPAWLTRADTERLVNRDLVLAGQFDVRETPTFFVNGVRVEGFQDLDQLKSVVEKELSQTRGLAALGTSGSELYRARVRKNMIGLGADIPERTCPPLGDSPWRGAPDALVTIVEFSEFECPFCKRAQPTLETLLARFGGDLRLVYKSFPLPHHRQARPAANLAFEAFAVGGATKFWRVHDLLFAKQDDLGEERFAEIAAQAGLDEKRLLDAVKRGAHDAKIEADARLGQKLGVRGVPAFFVNGRLSSGAQPIDRFSAIVQEELDGARRLVKSGTPRSRIYQTVCGL